MFGNVAGGGGKETAIFRMLSREALAAVPTVGTALAAFLLKDSLRQIVVRGFHFTRRKLSLNMSGCGFNGEGNRQRPAPPARLFAFNANAIILFAAIRRALVLPAS
jgi:hypothetical protein